MKLINLINYSTHRLNSEFKSYVLILYVTSILNCHVLINLIILNFIVILLTCVNQ